MSGVRIALIGCGTAAEYYHLPALRELVAPNDVWFVDPDLERAKHLAGLMGASRDHVAGTWEELDVDAAIVAAPNHLHAPIATGLLARDTHVLCEKPLATTADDGRRVLAAVGEDSVLAVGHFRRFFPSTPLLADLLRREVCGKAIRFDAEEGYVFAWEAQSADWLDPRKAGGGVVADLGPHVFDLLRVWFGELTVASLEDDALGGVEADALLGLEGRVPGTVELSRTRSLRNTIRIECEHGSIEAPLATPGEITMELDGTVHRFETGEPNPYPAAFHAQLLDFLDAIGTGRAPTVGSSDGLAVLELIDAAYAVRRPFPQPWLTEVP
jgi:predicted dehydrogenase